MKNILSKWNITPEELNQATAPARADEVSDFYFLKGRKEK